MAETNPNVGMRHEWLHTLIGIVAFGMVLWAGRWGLAGFFALPADHVLDRWQDPYQPLAPDERQWNLVVQHLEQAIQLESGNPVHRIRLASLHHNRALELPHWNPQASELLEQAATRYQQALQLRPLWGYGWINLAQVQVQAGNITDETIKALKQGVLLAPTSASVRRSAIRIGFALWSSLNHTDQLAILKLVEETLPTSGEYVLQQAKRYGQLALIRPMVEKSPIGRERLEKWQGKKP